MRFRTFCRSLRRFCRPCLHSASFGLCCGSSGWSQVSPDTNNRYPHFVAWVQGPSPACGLDGASSGLLRFNWLRTLVGQHVHRQVEPSSLDTSSLTVPKLGLLNMAPECPRTHSQPTSVATPRNHLYLGVACSTLRVALQVVGACTTVASFTAAAQPTCFESLCV